MFPNANIIIDKFHLTQLISRSLNKTRIMTMKKHKQHHKIIENLRDIGNLFLNLATNWILQNEKDSLVSKI